MIRGAAVRLGRLSGRLAIAARSWVLGVKRVPPNYAFLPRFRSGDVAIDAGTGDDPDFSRHLLAGYGLECFAVDPTRKHAPALRRLEGELRGFHYLPLALGPSTGKAEFYESLANVSGSLLPGHWNVVRDPLRSYQVEAVTFGELRRRVGRPSIAIAKLDLEGAEYAVIAGLQPADLEGVGQLLVEFHHDIVEGITQLQTGEAISRLKGLGFQPLVFNGRDCLFYR